MLLTNTQVSKLRKTSPNGSSANMKLSKTQLNKIEQSGGFLIEPLAKSFNITRINSSISNGCSYP